ncbi:LON peptidase substrate-binding domain-containing protein [Mariniblastus fucicola]|uniref:Lon protease 1 n=1 Tax=Mariniblastus fucicola TaxID=980251 RepID=A0A5B9PEG9_9BACT|nr:LON peptidase substrate-binding domain-containing protein [Mariniblastus fucicola]QEG23550.1 Lon protease 1 [Mariniblastus fucicola]
MSNSDFQIPDSFDGSVRLFPLPNLVLFPGVVQALNLFEPRYRQLMADVLSDDNLITMALVKPDPENLTMPVPEICNTVCVGKVMTHAKLENGTYNLLLAGVSRAVIVDELASDTLYRQARVKLIPEKSLLNADDKSLRTKLIQLFKNSRGVESEFDEEALDKLVSDKIEVGQLADLVAYASGISPMEQQLILETSDVRDRVETLISMLERLNEKVTMNDGGDSREFPPGFSLN